MTASPRKAIRRMSEKKRASLKGPVFSTISKRSESPRKRNPKRKASEFRRCYGSRERVLFVKGLPCSACGGAGYSENAHVPPKGEAGTGYKADYRFIAPLCLITVSIGCHALLHNNGRHWFEKYWDIDLEKCAAETERLWLSRIPEREE